MPGEQHDQGEQDESDRGGVVVVREVVDLLERRARERLVVVLDVAADDHDRAHLGECRAERGDHGREHADLGFTQCERGELEAAGSVRPRLGEEARREALDRSGGQGHDVRQGEDRLGDVHGGERERDVEGPECALRKEQEQEENTDDDRRQRKTRVGEDLERTASAEPPESERESDRQADEDREGGRDDRHLDRHPGDAEDVVVALGDQWDRMTDLVPQKAHSAVLLGRRV